VIICSNQKGNEKFINNRMCSKKDRKKERKRCKRGTENKHSQRWLEACILYSRQKL